MAIRIMPSVATQPMQSQAGGINGRVEPVRDASSGAISAIGTGMQQLGQSVTSAADQYQDNIDVAQSLRMRNLFSADVDAEMQDPQKGFLSTVGKDANNDRRKQSFERIAEKRRKIEALAQNETQRLNFTAYADRQDMESRQRANIHQERESKHFLAGELKVAAERDIERAATLEGTDQGKAAMLTAMESINKRADLFGLSADSAQRAAMVQGGKDAIYMMRIDMLTQDPMNAPQAAKYLAENRDKMSQGVLIKATDSVRGAVQLVQKAVVQDRSQRIADYLDQDPSASMTKKAAYVQKMFADGDIDVETRKAVMVNLKESSELRHREDQREDADALQAATEAKTAAQLVVGDYSQLPPGVQKKLDKSPAARREFDLFVLQGGQFRNTTRGVSALVFMEDSELGKYQTREQLRAVFQKELAPDKWDDLVKRWEAIQTGKAAPEQWKYDELKLRAIEAGMLPSATDGKRDKPDMSEPDKVTMLRLKSALDQIASPDGKPPTKAAIRDALDKVFGATLIENETGKKRVVAGLSAEELATTQWRGSTGSNYIELPGAPDARRIEARDRLVREARDAAEWNAANPDRQPRAIPNPDDPQALVDSMLLKQSEAKQASVQAALDDARRLTEEREASYRREQAMIDEMTRRQDERRSTAWSDFVSWFTNDEDVIDTTLVRNIIGLPPKNPPKKKGDK